jgi:lipopolysaccharide transport system permease protein
LPEKYFMSAPQTTHYSEIKPTSPFSLNFKELIEYRELFYFFAWRDIKVKYKQTVLGFLWAVLQPLMMMAVFTLLFSRTLQVSSGDLPYPIFVFSGINLWMIFSAGITSAGNSMLSNANIIKKIYFPRLIIPISAILVAVFDFLIAFLIFIVLLFYYGQYVNVPQALILWPASLLVAIIASFGPGCLLASLNVKYRDFRYVIPFMVQILLFVTPVIYPISVFKYESFKFLLALNPMYASLTIFRMPMSAEPTDLTLLSISLASGIIFLVVGIYYFRSTERYFADLT